MPIDELDIIIQKGEGYKTEYKSNVNSDLGKEMVAFANASGGAIYIGISDDGNILGVKDINSALSKIQSIANSCDPKLDVNIRKLHNLIVIEIPEGNEKPYRCTSGFYLRVGANCQKMGTRQIIDFIQQEGRIKFDELLCKQFNLESDFDKEKFSKYLKLAKISETLPVWSLLSNLNLVFDEEKNLVNNACALFFAKNPNNLIPQSSIVCALYKGSEKAEVLDRKEYSYDIVSNIEESMLFLKRQLKNRITINGLQREEKLELPEVALREALINAITHRDYFEKGVHVMLEIFDDRVEISNFGGLPKGLLMRDFGKRSLPRNPIIASLLLRIGYIERMGTGISRIKNELKKANLRPAEFQISSFFTITFFRKSSSGSSHEKEDDFGKISERFRKDFGSEFGKEAIPILNILMQNPYSTAQEIAQELKKTSRTIENYLSKLKKANIIIRRGPKLGGYWEVIDK